MSEKRVDARKIARYIKMGWKLTQYSCPLCGSPIVFKDNEYFCPICEKKVLIARDEAELISLTKATILHNLEQRILTEINRLLSESGDLSEYIELIEKYLKILKSINELRQG